MIYTLYESTTGHITNIQHIDLPEHLEQNLNGKSAIEGNYSTDEYYIPNDSKWHVERGQIYKLNPKLQFMKVPDRSVFLLMEHGIEVTENEIGRAHV